MKTIYKIAGLFSITFLMICTGCNDFDAMNENPNKPTPDMYDFNQSSLGTTLRYGIDLNFANVDGGLMGAAHLHERIKNLNVDFYSQYINPSAGWTTRNYIPNDSWNFDYWRAHFQWLASLNDIISEGEGIEARHNNLQIARIWRVYIQSQATDFFGSIPFPLVRVDNPDYVALDKQYEIFFAELDDAVKKMNPDLHIIGSEDPIYFGNFEKWRQFGNSLRLRLALKMSEVNPALCGQQAQAALNAPGGLMATDGDAKIAITSGWGNAYNYYMYQVSWGEKMSMTTTFQKILSGIGGLPYAGTALVHPGNVDPRGVRYFDPSVNESKWAGVYPGLNADEHVNVGPNNAYMSQIYVIPNDKRMIDCFLYDEVCFLLAEAYERGFIPGGTGQAKVWYENGVKSSLERWGVGSSATVYLASTAKNDWGTSAAYDDAPGAGNTKLEKIITQKYIAGYPDISYQAWNDKRRLNLPAFDVPRYRDPAVGYTNSTAILNPKNFINRQPFPQNEVLVNKAKYDAGVSLLSGPDNVSTNLWWDKDVNYSTSLNP